MKRPPLSALGLVFGFWCLWKIKAWSRSNFCHHQHCPKYTVIGTYGDIELRSYVVTSGGLGRTQWPMTRLHSNSSIDLERAELVLRNYIRKDKGYDIGSSPLIMFGDKRETNLYWYAPPDTEFTTKDPRVKMIYNHHPKVHFFVRPFSGEPTIQNVKDKAVDVRRDLEKAGVRRLSSDYSAAFYGSFSSRYLYKEVWIFQYT